jgi:hypothetical protein
MVFDNSLGDEKILLFNNGNILTNYSLGVFANTLFYNSPVYHNFYINGTSTAPIISIASSGATIYGTLTVTGAATAASFNTSSDYRIKEDIRKIPFYPNVDNLNPVTYKNTITGKQDIGFIAHELQEHFPFLVSGEKDGPTNQSVNYIGLIALLTKEIQDLKKEIREIKQTINKQ